MKLHSTLLLFFLLLVSSNAVQAQHPPRHLEPMQHKHVSQVGKIATHNDHPQLHWVLEWDTTASNWDSLYQYIDTYLPNGDLAEEVAYHYNGVAYDPDHRSQFIYGFQPLADRELYSIWNGTAWENEGKAELFYDAQGGLLAQVEYQWNGLGYDTTYADRSTYTYVFGNRASEGITETWNSSTHLYENDLRQTYHFPTAVSWDTATYYSWHGASWVEDYRFIDLVWFNFEKFLYASYRAQAWNMPGWGDQERVTGTLGPFDSPTYLHENWNVSAWDTAYLEVYGYDSLEHQVLFEYYEWSPGWMQTNGSRNEYIYDGLGQTIQITTSFWDHGQYVPAWLDVFANYFTVAIAPLTVVTGVTAYPNPCSDRLNFATDMKQNGPIAVEIYDQQGRLRTKAISAAMIGQEFSMPVSDFLENGTYIYVVKAEAGTTTGKVVVQR